MNFIVWLIAGAVIGWLMTYILNDRGIKSLFVNILLGITGAVLAGFLLTPMVYTSTIGGANFSIPAFLLSLGGAVVLLSVVHFLHRKSRVTDAEIQAKWAQVRSKICTRWNKLTEEDVEQINGNHDRFIKLLQERYGCDDKKAEEDLQSYLRAVV